MKKRIPLCMLTIMMVATAAITIASCSKSDNSSSINNNSGDISKIVGTWRGSDGDDTLTMTFNSDGTGIAVMTYDGYYGTETETVSFTYSMTDSNHGTVIVAIPYYNNSYYYESYPLEINGPNLYVYEDDEYYGMDIIWMLTKM